MRADQHNDQFRSPVDSFDGLDADAAGRLIAAATDLSLILDADGVIRDIAMAGGLFRGEGCGEWLGRPWVETLTPESLDKAAMIVDEIKSEGHSRWRELNHTSPSGTDLPIRYTGLRMGEDGTAILFGRDLRNVAKLQERLVSAQLAMEREYARLRSSETRYRLLFQLASEAVLVVDANSQRIVEANPAAIELSGGGRLVGRRLTQLFASEERATLEGILVASRGIGQSQKMKLDLADELGTVVVAVSLFRQESSSYYLVRLQMDADGARGTVPADRSALLNAMEQLPDALVVTDRDYRIITANTAFLDLLEMPSVDQARGQLFKRWFERPGVDFSVLSANLEEHEAVRRFSTVLRTDHGALEQVEIAAVRVPHGGAELAGFSIRNVGQPGRTQAAIDGLLPQTADQLVHLVGHMSLKDVVREATDVIERLCIEAALELTNDNRASAAQMLGLSRQSLYAKLRRFGIVDFSGDQED